MGSYAVIRVGPVDYHWKWHIPSIAAIIFRNEDFKCEKEYYPQHDEEITEETDCCYHTLGYYTTVEQARARLLLSGLTRSVLLEIYQEARSALAADWLETCILQAMDDPYLDEGEPAPYADETEAELGILELWSKFKPVSPEEEMTQFCEVLRDLMGSAPNGTSTKNRDPRGYEDGFQRYDDDEHPPWIPWLYNFYVSEGTNLAENGDISFAVQVLLTLEALDNNEEVVFDLSDMIQDEDEARSTLDELSGQLLTRMSVYRRLFFGLLKSDSGTQDQQIKNYCRELLGACDSAKDSFSKGRTLETFAETLFTTSGDFVVQSKNLNIGDEEIDVVLRNNIDKPFWNALVTPCVFLECKNWLEPVGSKEFRDFAAKVENHQAICKIGFLIALNGFTSEVKMARARLSREPFQLVLITRHDILAFFDSSTSFIDWLTSLVTKL